MGLFSVKRTDILPPNRRSSAYLSWKVDASHLRYTLEGASVNLIEVWGEGGVR